MKILALYDIHGNPDALDAVLADPRAQGPTWWWWAATPFPVHWRVRRWIASMGWLPGAVGARQRRA